MWIYMNMWSINVGEKIAKFPALRESADSIFKYIEEADYDRLRLDFSSVEFVSASFAHQLISNIKNSKKTIKLVGMNKDVKRMFKIVKNRLAKGSTAPYKSGEELPVVTIEAL